MITRRALLSSSLAGAAAVYATRASMAAEQTRYAVTHSDAEWRSLLSPAQYAVLRQSATERAFSSPLLHEKRDGVFNCAGCGQAAYSSATKFESGTGWPSFRAPLEGAVGKGEDRSHGMIRTEVHCSSCGSHLGHVFNDGPKPTGLRYCMNGLALTFTPAAG